jgi:hypothetical protein
MLKRKHVFTYLLLCLALLSGRALSFGAEGHRIIAGIAENHLSTKTAQAIASIGGDMRELAVWPDRIRGIHKYQNTKYWHYINIADHQQFETLKRSTRGDVLSALNHSYTQLGNPELPVDKRLEALGFFIHFVGDIHQPLHVGRQSDRGGNSVAIKWPPKNRVKNLHWVWDSGLIQIAELSVDAYIVRLDVVDEKQLQRWQQDSFLDWAKESKSLRSQVYEFGPRTSPATIGKKPLSISAGYIKRNQPIIEKRLLMAGIRLAGKLNEMFDPQNGASSATKVPESKQH